MTSKHYPDEDTRVEPSALDLGHLALFVGFAFADTVQQQITEKGFAGLRFSHGFIFQHLIGGERTIGELASRMEVTQQAASKAVAELEELGYLERVSDASDGRIRRVRLTERGRAAVTYARRARAALMRKLTSRHGADAVASAGALLADVLETLGGADAVRARRVMAPR